MQFKSLSLMVGISVLAASAAYAQTARVCFEAESTASIQKPLKIVSGGSNKPYSGKGYLAIPWDKNESKGKGQATYTFNAKTAGIYTIWARTFWENGCGNSILVTVNGGRDIILGEDGTYNKWHWVGGATRVKLKAGKNTLVLKNRETGVMVDQFFFSQDSGYTPTGIRKVTS
jgi:hypothetical protein